MPLPDLAQFCIQISQGPGALCITLPGGAQLCAQTGIEFGDTASIARSLLAQVNAALTPLVPIFNIIDVVKLVFDALGAVTNPFELAKILVKLGEKIDALLQLLPQYSVPRMVIAIIDALVAALQGLRAELQAIVAQQARIAAAATLAAQPGNEQLQIVVDCATGNFDAQLVNLNTTLAPLNRLLGIVNLLLGLAGQPALPSVADLGDDPQAALAPLDATIEALQAVQAALPG